MEETRCKIKRKNSNGINSKMFEEFKKKNEFQAVQNNQMAKLIREQNKKPLYHVMPQMIQKRKKVVEKKKEKSKDPQINQKMLEEFKKSRERENSKQTQKEEIKKEEIKKEEIIEQKQNSNFNEVMKREPEIQSERSNKIYREFKESQKKDEENDIEKKKYANLINKVKSLERELPKEENKKINSNNRFTKSFVSDYKIEGKKYELIKLSDKVLKNDFVKNGFHVIDLKMDKDPINGRINGKFNIRIRLNDVIDEEFEDYIRYRDMRIVSKRIF